MGMNTTTDVTRPHVRLYRYLKAEHAIAAIEHRNLRVSRLTDLNDPFEFEQFEYLVEGYSDKFGIICFSDAKTLPDPVIWSHYTDGHKGFALGFDVQISDALFPMTYPKMRPRLNRGEIEKMDSAHRKKKIMRSFSAKARNWKYEAETRLLIILSLCQMSGGDYFTPIPDDFLKHVILGIRCTISRSYVENALKQYGFKDVTITKARRSSSEFKVII